ncbi:hypothetical protein JCM10207_007560 [Rhodosporidiobolus poonsookiae]
MATLSPSPAWQSIDGNRAGMAAVASAALLSIVACSTLGGYIAFLLRRHHRLQGLEKLENEERRAIKFLTSSHGLLFLNLLAGDLLQASGFVLNFEWIRRNALPAAHSPTAVCTAQGVLIQIGDLGSAFSSLVICSNLFCILIMGFTPPTKVVAGVMAGQWVVIAMMSFIGPVGLVREGIPFYGPAGGWCWFSNIYQSERLWLHYFWVFLVAFLDLLLYTVMAAKIYLQRRALGNDQISGSAGIWRVMMLFPLVYVVTILPLSMYRIASMAGHTWPRHYALGAGFVFTLSGFANCTVYALTRSIVSFDSLGGAIGSAFRRGSEAVAANGQRSTGGGTLSAIASFVPAFFDTSSSSCERGTTRRSGGRLTSGINGGTSTFALNGIRVDVETDILDATSEVAYSPNMTCASPRVGRTPQYHVQWEGSPGGRRAPSDGHGHGGGAERPFSMLKKLDEEEDAIEEGTTEEESHDVGLSRSVC